MLIGGRPIVAIPIAGSTVQGNKPVRIFWQSFVDASANAPYMARLAEYLNEIAAPGTTVHVEGISPPDREFGRLS